MSRREPVVVRHAWATRNESTDFAALQQRRGEGSSQPLSNMVEVVLYTHRTVQSRGQRTRKIGAYAQTRHRVKGYSELSPLLARSDTTGDPKRTSQIVFPFRFSIFAPLTKERGGRTMAASWGLPSARPGFKNGAAPRARLADMVRLTHPVANLLDCALDRRRPRPCHHPEGTRLFVADVCCTCALLQAKAPQIGHYAPLGT